MSDDQTPFKPLDPGRVNLMDPVEAAYWCREFGCDEKLLDEAVANVGEHVAEVRAWLATRRG